MVKALIGCALASLLATSSASAKEPKADVEILELVQMFPGHWDNSAQVQAEAAKGVKPHEALVLDIVPIEAIMLGDNVFYVQESIAGDPNRVLGQKVVMFGVVKGKIVQTDFALNEPTRWRNGQNNPDLFKGLHDPGRPLDQRLQPALETRRVRQLRRLQRSQDLPQPRRSAWVSPPFSSKPNWARLSTQPPSRRSTSPATRSTLRRAILTTASADYRGTRTRRFVDQA